MAIDYGYFHFAAPRLCGSVWFVQAAEAVGLGRADPRKAGELFDGEAGGLRVSLVRHPCDFLATAFFKITPIVGRVPSFDGFVRGYLWAQPGSVGRLYDQYIADTVLRFEDLPGAFEELAVTVGIDRRLAALCKMIPLPFQDLTLPRWNQALRARVMRAEADIILRYDYY